MVQNRPTLLTKTQPNRVFELFRDLQRRFMSKLAKNPGWSTSFSPETIKLLDYVEMDPQTIPNGNGYGETLRIWNFDTYVDDPQRFMETYIAHTLEVIENN